MKNDITIKTALIFLTLISSKVFAQAKTFEGLSGAIGLGVVDTTIHQVEASCKRRQRERGVRKLEQKRKREKGKMSRKNERK